MNIYQFMAEHPVITVILGFFAMYSVVASVRGIALIIIAVLSKPK